MGIVKKKYSENVDEDTGEVVKVSKLDNDNYMIVINGVENQLKAAIFEELSNDMREFVLG